MRILLVLLVATVVSCTPRPEDQPGGASRTDSRQSDPAREYYILPVDSVMLAGLNVKITGPLGDGCQQFAYIDSIRQGNSLVLTLWASRPKAKDVACTMIMQYYDKSIALTGGQYREVIVNGQGSNRIYKPLR